MNKRLNVLIIMDGYAVSDEVEGNAILAANTPCLDKLFETCPFTLINASGQEVGLPEGQMGNSEVGHTNIGAGRVIYQELTRITKAVNDGDFYKNKALLGAISNCKLKKSALHLIGLLSDGGVHSHNTHLYALLKLAKKEGLDRVYIHAFLDGRDVSPVSGVGFIQELEEQIKEIGVGTIASVMGRYYAMDRDNRWDRVNLGYSAMVYREGEKATSAEDYVKVSYNKDVTDEFVLPAVLEGGEGIKSGDSVICFNFRPDRAREITRTLVDEEFSGFERKEGFFPVFYVCMTQYDSNMPNVHVAFKPESLNNTFGEYIAKKGYKQLRIAETEKYAHVTFFFNGGVEKAEEGEDRILIPSSKVATYDLKPEMSAIEVKDQVIEKIKSGEYDNIIMNFANCDMVGHTGYMKSAISAVETVDACVGEVVDEILKKGGIAVITADHGNADKLLDGGDVFTAHTTNPVPLIIVGEDVQLKNGGKLADIAPTMLDLMGLPKPAEMTGESLIKK